MLATEESTEMNLHPQAFSVFCKYWIFCGTEMQEHCHTVCLCYNKKNGTLTDNSDAKKGTTKGFMEHQLITQGYFLIFGQL